MIITRTSTRRRAQATLSIARADQTRELLAAQIAPQDNEVRCVSHA
ncbi:MAG: hypothetical protein ABI616_01245 [Pseudomonadota bacterium]